MADNILPHNYKELDKLDKGAFALIITGKDFVHGMITGRITSYSPFSVQVRTGRNYKDIAYFTHYRPATPEEIEAYNHKMKTQELDVPTQMLMNAYRNCATISGTGE